jgi:hypothetical protein
MNAKVWSTALLGAAAFVGLIGFVDAGGGSWGTITGHITWGGAVPERAPLDLKANADKAVCEKNGKLLDETWIVNPKNKGLKNTFVWLEGEKKGDKLPIHPDLAKGPTTKIEIDQPTCMFIPHAIALREGQAIAAKNSSPIAHNFKWQGNPAVNAGGNRLVPPGGSFDIDDLKADRLPVTIECNIHPWMKGYVRVFNHPYYAVTDADGNFKIEKAPAGSWRLKIWNGSGGWAGGVKGKDGQPITVKAGDNNVGAIVYPAPN